MTDLFVNIDVDDIEAATSFYTRVFGLRVGRALGADFSELLGASVAVARALDAGATLERAPRREPYGWLALLADPLGHGFCFLQLEGRGYDEIAT